MAIADVSGVGNNSKRTDRNLTDRVQSIQRKARIENASGGMSGDRKRNQEFASSISTGKTAATGSTPINIPAETPVARTPRTGIFDPGDPNVALTDGADMETAGRGSDALLSNFNTPDSGSVLARAMYMAYPTPEMRAIVEAFNQENI